MTNGNFHYYRIYDDKEEFNYIKCRLDHKGFEEIIKNYEKRHQQYLNDSLVKFLQRTDPEAELIEVEEISY